MKENTRENYKQWPKFGVLKTEQPGKTLYTVSISARWLVEHAIVLDRVNTPNSEGIQRLRKPGRCRHIANFVSRDDALLANNIIGNIDASSVVFEDGFVYMDPTPGKKHEIVDGQHRLWGFSPEFNEEGSDFEILYTFLVDATPRERASLFYRINKEQKKINPSLAYDLLSVINDGSMEQHLSELMKRLNENRDSPFYEKIKVTEADEGTVSLAHMTHKFQKFLATEMGREFVKEGNIKQDVLYEVVKNYFGAIREIFPNEWDGIDENGEPVDSVLVKTLGTGAFIELLGAVLLELRTKLGKNIPTKADFKETLEPLEGTDILKDEDIGSFGGEKGQKQLANKLREELDFDTYGD